MPVWYYATALILLLLVGIIAYAALAKVRAGEYTRASVFGRSPPHFPTPAAAVVKMTTPVLLAIVVAVATGNLGGAALAVVVVCALGFAVLVYFAASKRNPRQASSD